MFQKYFLLAAIVSFASTLSAQKLIVNPSDTISASRNIREGFTTEFTAYVVNNTLGLIDLKWRFLDYGGSSNDYSYTMCDAYNCYAAGPQTRVIDLTTGDSTFMKFGVDGPCVGGTAYGTILLWIDGDSASSARSITYIVELDDADCLSSVNDAERISFKFYPNPASGFIHVALDVFETETSVVVFNLLGTAVASFPVSATHALLDVSGLANGSYLLCMAKGNAMSKPKQFVKF